MKTKNTNLVQKAGGILPKDTNGIRQYLILFRESQRDYSFPKGHINNNEFAKDAAKREFFEETGLRVEPVKRLTPNRYFNQRTGKNNIIHMYLLETVSGKLKTEHLSDRIIWADECEIKKLFSKQLFDYFLSIKHELLT